MTSRRRFGASSRDPIACSLALLALAGTARTGSAQSAGVPQISVVTFGVGSAIHQYFGHNALVVSTPGEALPTVFNYGTFSFGPEMIPKFLTGRLEFWLGTSPLDKTIAAYKRMNRDLRLRELNLEPAVSLAIAREVAHDALPENRVYLYDHYFDNCSTRARDVLDAALHGQLREAWSGPAKFTLRQLTRRYTQHDPIVEWLMMFGLNDTVDRPLRVWDQAFLPDEFERLLDVTSYMNGAGARVPIVKRRVNVFLARRMPVADAPYTRWPITLALGCIVGLSALILAARSRARGNALRAFVLLAIVAGLAVGLLGTSLWLMWAFSDHVVTYHNENLLLASPVTLFAGVAGVLFWRRAMSARWLFLAWSVLAATTVLLLICWLVVPAFDQDVALTATLLAPINLGLALGSYRIWSYERAGSWRSQPAIPSPAESDLR